jgi:hypothetical protein
MTRNTVGARLALYIAQTLSDSKLSELPCSEGNIAGGNKDKIGDLEDIMLENIGASQEFLDNPGGPPASSTLKTCITRALKVARSFSEPVELKDFGLNKTQITAVYSTDAQLAEARDDLN